MRTLNALMCLCYEYSGTTPRARADTLRDALASRSLPLYTSAAMLLGSSRR
jgi:hypothetical protein